jgi:hypothetical protein
MLTGIKYLKDVKGLCWSNKVEAGSAVFVKMRSVLLLLGGVKFGCGDLLSYLYACIMPFVLYARLVLLSSEVVVRVFSRA